MTDEQRKALSLRSTAEVAALLRVTPKTVLNRRARIGECGVMLGRDWLFTEADVEALRNPPDRRRKKKA